MRSLFLASLIVLSGVTPVLAVPDVDGDGYPAGVDCNDNDATVWQIPGETTNLLFAGNKTTLSWNPPVSLGGTPASVSYDTLRASYPYDFSCDLAVCTSSYAIPTSSSDAAIPASGSAYYYVSRAKNSCGVGTIGYRSSGAQRPALTSNCEGLCQVTNGGFDQGLLGWILEGDCTYASQLIVDDALHGNAFALSFTGGGACGPTKLWQVAAVDVDSQASVRVRVDVKLMRYGGFYTGPVNVRIYTGIAPTYDQQLIGSHVFQPGAFVEDNALSATTTIPVGTWYAFTSDDIKPLMPAGAQFVRVELWEGGASNYGWGRFDNVKVVLNDAAVPAGTASPDLQAGHPPLLVQFTGTCSDGDGVCVGTTWDFGDGPVEITTPGGGGTSVAMSPSYTFSASEAHDVSYTVEDDRGAARSVFTTVTPVNQPPTVSIGAAPGSGGSPLFVQFTANVSDDHLISSYAWSFGDGGTSTAANPGHTFTAPGTYDVTLTVTDDHGATGTARYSVVATGPQAIANGGFSSGSAGWVLDGNCTYASQLIADDGVHGTTFALNFTGGGGCGPTTLWQVGAVDVDAQSSVRVRADVKLMMLYGIYQGPVNLRVYAGTSSPYDQQLVGNHVFQPGSFSPNNALVATTTHPVGTWYSFTSDDIKPLIPAGTQFLRVELWVDGGAGVYGWGRVDNVKIVLNDAAMPVGTASPDQQTGHPPLLVQFTGTCSDGDGSCVATTWDFGDGPVNTTTAGGGGSSTSMSPSYTFNGSQTYNVSYTVEDDRGAARTVFTIVSPVNQPPTASITAAPGSGAAPLFVQFTANVNDDHLISSYAWSFGDGGTSTAANPGYSYTTPGTYQVALTVTDDHGATATAGYTIVATGPQRIANGDFSSGSAGWVLDGNCTYASQLITDDALHGNAFALSFTGGGGCGPTKLWQVGAVDVDAQSSVRVRADVKLMMLYGIYQGPANLRVYAGNSSPYDQQLVGNHVFLPGGFAQDHALNGTTTLPVGTWYAFTSDDIKPLIPTGTQFLRVELWVDGGAGSYGWGRFDNVKLVLNDAAAPVPAANANPTSGSPPLLVQFTGSCSDGDGTCVGTAWDFGDGPVGTTTPGGGGTSTSASPSYTFSGSRTYNVSLTVEDDKGAARSTVNSVSTVNAPPTVSIQAVPDSGDAPLMVQFTAVASDDGSIASYAWNFGDGGTSTAQNPSHIYGQPGTYGVTLTVTDDQGAFATANYAIVVTTP